ncbi:MAG: 16S rRNA processing protein RimM [Acidimicrobiaceae bacterium]|nr:16S rRNA processing protein RimM [Acidimicrobiaceae bacterium]
MPLWKSSSDKDQNVTMAERTLEVGYILKAHGIKGEVIVVLTTNRSERVAPGTLLTSSDMNLHIVSSSPHQGRWIVQFEGIHTRTLAESLKGKSLSAPAIVDDSEIWVDEIVGLPVFDQNGRQLGIVQALQSNPASDLLVLESGELIPLAFVLEGEMDYHRSGSIHVKIPEGLLESGL